MTNYIKRDISTRLKSNRSAVQLLIGPRQCGKSTLLSHLFENSAQELTFDDLQLRTMANNDPQLFLAEFQLPLLLE